MSLHQNYILLKITTYCVKYKEMSKKMTVNTCNYVWMRVLFTHCCEIESTLSRLKYYQITKNTFHLHLSLFISPFYQIHAYFIHSLCRAIMTIHMYKPPPPLFVAKTDIL